jgi:acetyl-CoA carboxylase biotin carboxyl carrier protein
MAKQGKPKADDRLDDDDAPGSTEPGLVALVRGFAEIVATHGLTELIVDTKDTTLTLRRGEHGAVHHAPPVVHHASHLVHPAPLHAAPVAHAAPAAPAPAVDDKAHVVTSPFVGTFYRKPNPDSASYVSLNDRVEKGAVLCIVEAMKLMNEIEADVSGTVVGILAEDGAPVEYGQALFRIAT